MSCDFIALAQPGVQKLSPYVPGKPVDELARELGLDPAGIVKLASNENPLGPSPKALAAIHVDDEDAEETTKAAMEVIDEADLGSEEAELALGDCEDNLMSWYGPQELPFLVDLL